MSFFQGHLIAVFQVGDGYGGDAVPQGPQAIVTQSDLKGDFCRLANGKQPLRLKAEIKREEEQKREDGKKREEQGKCFQFPRDRRNEHRSGEVSVSVLSRVSLVNSVNINQPKCTMWDCSHNRWQERCSIQLGDAVVLIPN